MSYPEKPSGNYTLRSYNFAEDDTAKTPMDEYLFKHGYKNADESETESVPDAHEQNWFFDILHRNLRYTMGVAEENKSVLETKTASSTTLGQIKVGYGLLISSDGTLQVQKQIAENAQIISYDLPVGSYMLWGGESIPSYFIEPSGQTLYRSDYPELWNFAVNNNLIGKLFGDGDGSTTFTVTDIRGHFISIANSNAMLGTHTDAGLPDIVARMSNENGQANDYIGSGSTNLENAYWHASAWNSIYGRSNTVMPENWALKLILKAQPTPPAYAVPTGTILSYTGSQAPDGYIIANGASLSRTDFNSLYSWASQQGLIIDQSLIPTTAHGYFGSGDGSSTFTIPDLRGVFGRYADLSSNRGGANLGVYQPDGLPNITGHFGPVDDMSGGYRAGCFYNYGGIGYDAGSQWSGGGWIVGFDASIVSGIYGNATSVQPKSVSVLPIIKY